MTSILKAVVDNHGYVATNEELKALAEQHPTLPLVIKFGMSPRVRLPASEIQRAIDNADSGDYVREVFLSAETLDAINETLK